MGGIRNQKGDDAAPIQVIDELQGADLDLPAVARHAGSRSRRRGRPRAGPCRLADSRGHARERRGLLDGKDGKAALVAEVHAGERAADVRLGARRKAPPAAARSPNLA